MGDRFYTVRVDDIYLTSDGTVNTSDCKIAVEGIPELQSDYNKVLRYDFRGNLIIQKTEVGKNSRTIVLRAGVQIPKAVGDSLIALHRAAEADDTPFQLTGDKTNSPSFDLMVLPGNTPAFTWTDTDRLGNYRKAELRYATVGDIEMRDEDFSLIDDTFEMIDL